MYTNAKRFRVRATVDIARLPSSFHGPVERDSENMCHSVERDSENLCNLWLTDDDQIRAKLTLNNQAIVPGQPLIAMAIVDNLTPCDVSYHF